MKTDGTTKEAGTGATAPTEGKQPAKVTKPADTIGGLIEKLKPQLEKALPKHVTPERLARVALTAIRNNAKLQAADSMSLMESIMVAAQLGLEPNTPLGQCYIIPYSDNKNGTINAQFQMGYKGIIDLGHRTGQYKSIYAHAVDKADEFRFSYGLHQDLHHIPASKPSGEKSYFYAVYHLVNGGYDFRVWSADQVFEHAQKYSKTWDKTAKDFKWGSPWKDNFDSMACKTMLIDLLRYAPKSVEIAEAASRDNLTMRLNPDDPDLSIDTIDGDFQVQGE